MTQILPEPIQFGRYALYERIGRGGMADVFKARIQGPAGFERVFVIKRILPHLSDDPTFVEMLIQEAKLSARLIHANIVQIFELGAVDGEYFISMEHVPGHDLAETTRAMWKQFGAPRPELVAFIGREMCRGLSYAHDLLGEDGRPQGMIHRDVSPPNVMLAYEGAVKLVDFGIAKALGDAPDLTNNGTIKGKYAYMAPEQTDGGELDHRTDIFATGIVLHEVLTGRRLFKGANDIQTVERVRECEVRPPSEFNRLCPRALDEIVLRALSRDPEKRFPTAGEMADALDDVVHAAHFTSQHLAGVLRTVFAGEPGTSSASERRLTASSSSISRPASQSPSTTIPPVAIVASSERPTVPLGPGSARAAEEPGREATPTVWWQRRASWAVTGACAGIIGVVLATSAARGRGGRGSDTAAKTAPLGGVMAVPAPQGKAAPPEAMPSPPAVQDPVVPPAPSIPIGAPESAAPIADQDSTGAEGPVEQTSPETPSTHADFVGKKGRPPRPLRKPRHEDPEVAATENKAADARSHGTDPEESIRAKASRTEIVDPFHTEPVVVNPF